MRSDASLHISVHSPLVKVTNYPYHYVFYFLIYGCYGFIQLSTGATKSHLVGLCLLMINVLQNKAMGCSRSADYKFESMIWYFLCISQPVTHQKKETRNKFLFILSSQIPIFEVISKKVLTRVMVGSEKFCRKRKY